MKRPKHTKHTFIITVNVLQNPAEVQVLTDERLRLEAEKEETAWRHESARKALAQTSERELRELRAAADDQASRSRTGVYGVLRAL